jgi:hypothetical protein
LLSAECVEAVQETSAQPCWILRTFRYYRLQNWETLGRETRLGFEEDRNIILRGEGNWQPVQLLHKWRRDKRLLFTGL